MVREIGMMKSSRRHQTGATLLEALAFLGIAAIVVVGAISMFRAAQGSAQANAMVSELNGLRSSIRTIYATQSYGGAQIFDLTSTLSIGGGGGAYNRTLWLAGAIPNTYAMFGAFLFRTSYGAIFVFRPGLSQDNTDLFVLKFDQVSQEICLKVAPQIGGSWLGLQINANPFVSTDTEAFPVATANAQCTPGTSNTMIFVSR